MTKLSVNINKVALLRNARGGNLPDLLQVARDSERFGAEGITVHPRPDGRHIRYQDVYDLKKEVTTEFNIEGYPGESFMKLVLEVRPTQVTLVPDAPDALTSDAGWDTVRHAAFLRDIIDALHGAGIRSSLFVGTELPLIEQAARLVTDRIELYTGPYAAAYEREGLSAVVPFLAAAETARGCGLGVNAGHDLNLLNLTDFHRSIPFVDEVSIGHALISDALYLGLEKTIKSYKNCLK